MRRSIRSDRGNVSLLVVIMIPALLIAAGLVLDGGVQIQQRRAAGADASAAARAAVQYSDAELRSGAQLDAGLARGRAQAELGARGISGSVQVNGNTVTVTVSRDVSYAILPGGDTVSATASATAFVGVTEGARG